MPPYRLSAGRQGRGIDPGDPSPRTVDQPHPITLNRQAGDVSRIKDQVSLQNKSARLVHEHTFRTEYPETPTLRVQLQVTHAGTLRIVSLGEGYR